MQNTFTKQEIEMILDGLYMLENESRVDESDPVWTSAVSKTKEMQTAE